jgi:RNA polymerase sigma factor (sigma-70 family)
MLPPDQSLSEMRDARERFLALVAEVRPDLHRYCARMTGSVADGEDVVQETLARAYFMLPELATLPELRPWLFRVAHRRAIDFLRRYDRRMGEPIEADSPLAAEGLATADDALAGQEAVAAALARFLELPPVPRSCVILKDVLGHSLDEIGALLDLGVPAVKAALYRGRERLRSTSGEVAAAEAKARAPSPAIARYMALFNARDWDAVRAMLADDVRLDLVARAQRRGRREVSHYLTNYDAAHDWYLRAAWLGEREVIAVLRHASAPAPAYFIEIGVDDERVKHIRDYRYVPYIAVDAPLRLA